MKSPSEVSHRHVGWLTAAGTLASAGLLRAARDYRSFPSIDDFAYIPMAFARMDPLLYPRDMLLRETPLHVPLLPPLVAILQATTSLQLGFWLITIVLSLLTVLAMYRWMRALGVPGALLPVAAIVACAGWVQGLGRGEYDGVFGDSFHFQWAALCALLWAYDGVLRARWVPVAALLVLSLLLHPVVGAHGIVAITCGLAFARGSSTRARSWLFPVAVAACALVGVFVASPPRGTNAESIANLPDVVQGILFRLPQEFEIDQLKVALVLVVAAAGISGIARLARQTMTTPVASMLGLLFGHIVLLGVACVLYEARSVAHWSTWTLVPFQLSLSRTTPILLALSGASAVAGLEAGFLQKSLDQRSLRGVAWLVTRGVQAATVVGLAVVQVRWSWEIGLCCGVAVLTAIAIRERIGYRTLTVVWLVALVGGLVLFARSTPLSVPMNTDQEQLLRWARSSTAVDALFIIPPSLQEFRFYAQRSVYVDFKTVTPADSGLVRLWRRRLEQVAAPDRLAREARGWKGVPEWDRTYAGRNTPERIKSLLRETAADYFVWDRDGLKMPPFVGRDRAPDAALVISFENARYKVYRVAR